MGLKRGIGGMKNSLQTTASIIGTQATVVTPIRGVAFGEVTYFAHGGTTTSPARNVDTLSPVIIPSGSIVIIRNVAGATLFVEQMKIENTVE